MLSAASNTTAEPVAPRCGTHTTFITTLSVAPMIEALSSTPSRLRGISICMAKICAKPTASSAGIIICIGTTAPAKPSPAMTYIICGAITMLHAISGSEKVATAENDLERSV